MTASSADPVHQRYTAGDCTLDVTLQLSALSQWYPRPITQQLRFKLWLHSAEGAQTAATLVAQGDREMLQTVARQLQQQTRSTLALANFSTDPPSNVSAQSSPDFLIGEIAQPLSALQLCDLTSVVNQYEQAIHTLPEALSPALEDGISTRTSGVLIPFAIARRRPKLWASAAAAVFAIGVTAGLTTVLRPSSQERATTADSALSEPEAASEPDYSAPRQTTVPTPSASSSSSEESESDDASPERSTASSGSRQANRIAAADSPSQPTERQPARPSSNQSVADPNQSASAPKQPSSSDSIAPSDASPPASVSEDTPTAARQAESLAEPPAAGAASDGAAPTGNDEFSVANPSPSVSSPPASAPPVSTATSGEANTIAQVQSYFKARWQPPSSGLQAPLTYQLRLSASGEVIAFVALSEAAQAYRDRLLPADQPPTFPMAPSPENTDRRIAQSASNGLTLRLVLTADGQVQVYKF